MTTSAISLLRCPVCKQPGVLTADGRVFRCCGASPHSFDLSGSGYLNLSRSQKSGGDSAEAVRARSAFLEKGYYQPLADRLLSMLNPAGARVVIDAGCGEGYYTNRLAQSGRTLLGADLSKAAVNHAAKQAKRMGSDALFLVASLFDLPVADGCADAVVNLFAPCAEQEFLRVLKPGGILILAGAGKDHLMGLKQVLYSTPYQNPGRADLPRGMKLLSRERLFYRAEIRGREDIEALFSMTPYYFRTARKDREKLNALDVLETEIDFDLFCYRKETGL